ncbi:hypothetical protein L6452_06033 [Arctium lappa]|uniref:Uncharacterized protein n=1 Tax=Arctium lappa TaxID=4217 RepID=A0ACB9EIA6_ARCLA|nr:hypothetical protein L6452_06033 [Arctium lappa]
MLAGCVVLCPSNSDHDNPKDRSMRSEFDQISNRYKKKFMLSIIRCKSQKPLLCEQKLLAVQLHHVKSEEVPAEPVTSSGEKSK